MASLAVRRILHIQLNYSEPNLFLAAAMASLAEFSALNLALASAARTASITPESIGGPSTMLAKEATVVL